MKFFRNLHEKCRHDVAELRDEIACLKYEQRRVQFLVEQRLTELEEQRRKHE